VPFCPEYVDPELGSVLVPKGEVSQAQWWEALAFRVAELVSKEHDPQAAMYQAARALGTGLPDDPQEAGAMFVLSNLQLKNALSHQANDHSLQFPAKAALGNPSAKQALKEVDLQRWVELASSQVSESSLE
jgi:hypothetical protein